jgi:hypothetical protein
MRAHFSDGEIDVDDGLLSSVVARLDVKPLGAAEEALLLGALGGDDAPSDDEATPEVLLQSARVVMTRPDKVWGGVWPRAAALLARQALEDGVDRVWVGPLAGMRWATAAAQMVCLREYLDDRPLAASAYATWCALSNACHAHPFDLAPTADELRGWGDVVARLLAATVAPVDRSDR